MQTYYNIRLTKEEKKYTVQEINTKMIDGTHTSELRIQTVKYII